MGMVVFFCCFVKKDKLQIGCNSFMLLFGWGSVEVVRRDRKK
jgi:hypothetical protein